MRVATSPFEQILLGPQSDIQLRTYYESLRSYMQTEQSSWLPHWSQLARFNLPRSSRFNPINQPDQGQRKDYDIVDNCATLALRTCSAGMMGGMSSPSREWFKVQPEDDELRELSEVQDYCEHGADQVRNAFLKSNVYPTLVNAYRDMALYGTQAFSVVEDREDDIRCFPYPIGSYMVAGDSALRITLILRIVNMTAAQIVADYPRENISSQVLSYFDSPSGGQKETWWPVVQVIHPNTYYGSLAHKFKRWVSVHYELNTYAVEKGEGKLLRRSGFNENPIICSRWDITGENFYGNSPGMDCLGDVMGLQLLQKRKSEAVDKMVKPPMIASPAMANQKMSILPGDITYGDMKDGSMGFKPAFEMKFDIEHVLEDIREHHDRIEDAYYKKLFLMISESDRRQVTAEEIRAKQEEKMLVLGPVLERSNNELFKPLIQRTWNILRRKGKIPAPPEVLRGKAPGFHFESILAQAQRMLKIASLDRWNNFVSSQIAVDPSAGDLMNRDEMNREYGEDLSVPPKCMNSDEDIQKIREQRMKTQQAQQIAANAKNLAPAVAALGQTAGGGAPDLSGISKAIGQPG
jgi:hypothetical protein